MLLLLVLHTETNNSVFISHRLTDVSSYLCRGSGQMLYQYLKFRPFRIYWANEVNLRRTIISIVVNVKNTVSNRFVYGMVSLFRLYFVSHCIFQCNTSCLSYNNNVLYCIGFSVCIHICNKMFGRCVLAYV